MSDLLIRNFDPPKYGYREIRIHPNGRVTEVDECGLDEAVGMAEYIPPHGRLGDLDRLAKEVKDMAKEFPSDSIGAERYRLFTEFIKTVPTIIPASEERT